MINVSAPALSTAPTNSASSSSSGTPSNELTGNSFITLLTAQLQAQDPFDPMDPTTFLNELVQFNSLQQLININTLLAQALGGSAAPTQASSAARPAGRTQY
ncbi:MAG TPA: flagellar hook capping FlgD N-terminal domain-containing protein [Candidatus Binatia bacterium]|nr:flagellar hook capping FlgD N-terminal domain-containing protein [Candidatus Binatia bacterium]